MEEQLVKQRVNWLYLLIGMAVILNLSGLFVTIIGPDGALYASISKTMALNNNFAELFVEGRDWLDKPHFPFWMAAFSFKVFGISTWAYKLPAILFLLLGALYTYKLAAELYTKEIALWSALILLTAQHIIISSTDVRAEPYLTGLIIAAVYHYYRAFGKGWVVHVLLGSLFAACAVMTKGIFALIPIFGAIAIPLVIFKDWKMLFNIRWLFAFVLIGIMILPELWCLYLQFDSHPEKAIFEQNNVSGLKFFFWDSQFGRFFNTGPIKKAGGDPSFFLHTSLWAFLPWAIVFYCGIVHFIRTKTFRLSVGDWLSVTAIALTLVVLSASSFQLPHYIIIIFPFFAIVTARYVNSIKTLKTLKGINVVLYVVVGLLVTLVIIIHFLFLPELSMLLIMVLAMMLFTGIYISRMELGKLKVLFQTALVAIFINFYFNLAYYPKLTTYQADSEAAFWLNMHNTAQLPVVKMVNNYAYAINFYADTEVHNYRQGEEHLLPKKPYLLFAETEQIDQMIKDGVHLENVKTFESYRITRLKLKFLNSKTRSKVLSSSQIVLVK